MHLARLRGRRDDAFVSTELDRRTMVEAVKYARKVASASPIAHLMKREVPSGRKKVEEFVSEGRFVP